jgi:sialidase-1
MTKIKDLTHHFIHKDPALFHCENQVSVKQLSDGQVLVVFNEERYPYHSDTGQTVMVRSTDGGITFDPATKQTIVAWTEQTGNWDCGLSELSDGTLLVNFTLRAFFKRGIKPEQPSWSSEPMTQEWGDWTWAYRLWRWIGTYVVKSNDKGQTWSDKIPVNVVPLTHAGCRLGCWQMPSGSILMGVYGRIRGYEEAGEHETSRSSLIRSDDNGENWEYYSTMAYDPASIINFTEPALLRLKDGRLVGFLRTEVLPSSDAKNLAMVVSEDDGFSWTLPKFTNIWGYPAELIQLQDGRYLMVYGYRRPPYGVRGVVSEDGLTWDVKNEFVIRQGGVPGEHASDQPDSTMIDPTSGRVLGGVDWKNPGIYQHIGYPSVVQLKDGTILVAYHE